MRTECLHITTDCNFGETHTLPEAELLWQQNNHICRLGRAKGAVASGTDLSRADSGRVGKSRGARVSHVMPRGPLRDLSLLKVIYTSVNAIRCRTGTSVSDRNKRCRRRNLRPLFRQSWSATEWKESTTKQLRWIRCVPSVGWGSCSVSEPLCDK